MLLEVYVILIFKSGLRVEPMTPKYIPVSNNVGRGGSLVDSAPFVRRIAGSNHALAATRVVQYVGLYCMMHKCILVKTRGRKNTQTRQKAQKSKENRGNLEKKGEIKNYSFAK